MNTNTNPEFEQGGVSALKAIEYLQPLVQRILDTDVAEGNEKVAAKQFATDYKAELSKLSEPELALIGHRLLALNEVTNKVLTLMAINAISRVVDPSLS